VRAIDRLQAALAANGCEPKRRGDHLDAKCPSHDDRVSSLTAHQTPDRVLVKCHAGGGCAIENIAAALGMTTADLFDEPIEKCPARRITARYGYTDEAGTLLYEVVRYDPKDFRQRRPDGTGGWTWKLGNVRRVPYRLPELIGGIVAGRWIVVVEGEKDANRLVREGFIATCNAGGAGKFLPTFAPHFKGANVAILPDRDEPGRSHAQQVASLLSPVASKVKIIELPGRSEHGDVSDFLDDGGSAQELKRLIVEAPCWDPAPVLVRGTTRDITERLSVRLVPAATVAAQQTKWAWRDRIPLGGVCLMVGQEGSGKTTILTSLFARASRGQLEGDLQGMPVASVYATAEDSWARTLRPRLETAGADLDRVHFVEINGLAGGLSIPGDLNALAAEMRRTGALLLALDPFGAHLLGTIDTHRDASVRQALAPLAAHMDELGAAAVGVMHWSKAPSTVALDRVNGSRGFTAAARAVLAVGDDPADPGAHVLVVAKSNLGRLDVPALRYRIEGRTVPGPEHEPINTSGVVWLGEAPGITARDLFPAPVDDGERSDRGAVAEVIREVLADGPRPREDVVKAIQVAGLTVGNKTIQRTCRELGVERKRIGFGSGASFMLALRERSMVDQSDNAPMARDAVHYVQNGLDQDHRDSAASMVDIVDIRRGPRLECELPADDDTEGEFVAARLALEQALGDAQLAYDSAMAPAWAVLATAKATGDREHVFDVYHRDFEPVWFAADVAFRAVRDQAEQAFRQSTGREPWESFSGDPFDGGEGAPC